MSFIHLHVYSAYSLLTSTVSIKKLVENAKQAGYAAIALTDRNVMYGTMAFYKECLQQGIKPIIGLTVDVMSAGQNEEAYPLVLLAKNNEGYRHLLKISSAVQTKSPDGIPIKWLKHYANGLIAITPGETGEIETAFFAGKQEQAKEVLERFRGIFGKGNFYLSMQKYHSADENGRNGEWLHFAAEAGVEVVATNEVHYLNEEDAFAYQCLLAIKENTQISEEDREISGQPYYLKTLKEMESLFSTETAALENSGKIAAACNVTIEIGKRHLPKYPVEEGVTAEQFLEKLCEKGLQERYVTITQKHKERLQYELNIIKHMHFSDYFLIVWDFIHFARKKNILTGPGRGSSASSIVAYCLYITDVDPMEYDLLFERFLNPERLSMPDIDVDFPDHRRDEVIAYVANKYGTLHVAQIITFGTLAAKAVLRDVGRIFQLSAKELDRLSRCVPSRLGITLESAYKESAPLRQFIQESPRNRLIYETARKLEGLPRHASTHAAGVVISKEPLVDTVPIQNGHDNIYLTQFSMEFLEELGLLKMDFLGLRNLTLLEAILTSIYRKTGKRLELKQLPLQDQKTFQLLSRGDTSGVFQLESSGMRRVLRQLHPTCFEDIVAVNALYRPGPMDHIPMFIKRKHGEEHVDYPHRDLQPILENTYGIIVYQEQIMQIAAKLAGFTLGEADLLRRAVSKKKKLILDKERGHFVNGAVEKGYGRQTADEVYDLIVRFANYGFPRSHAVAYSFIAYQLAYLKCHYPLHFMAALLTFAVGNESKVAQYIREAKQLGITILPPSINKSGSAFLVEQDAIRFSLAAIKGIGVAALKELFRHRKEKRYSDLFDLCIRTSGKIINRAVLVSLVQSGCLDEFGENRATLLASLDVAIDHAQLVKPDDKDQSDLFAEFGLSLKPKYVKMDPYTIEEKLQYEKKVLGLYLSDHPLAAYEKYMPALHIQLLSELHEAGKAAKCLIYITEVKQIRTKKGEKMAFSVIQDQSAEMDAVIFPNTFKQINLIMQKGNIVLIQGKLEERDQKKQFIIHQAMEAKAAVAKLEKGAQILFLKIPKLLVREETMEMVKAILVKSRGCVPVIIHDEKTKQNTQLGKKYHINPAVSFMQELEGLLGAENVIIKSVNTANFITRIDQM
ncbi:DNA polymerase III subunit alpha [Bacillaceae bacterium Marseille-Q3522]|nr:DNA polymerase III subunit alpha [Bacillaceae bacterium Marseille-Q3522]